MDNRRIALALVIALLVSGVATAVFYTKVRKQRDAQPKTSKIVAAKDVLRAGTQLSAENVALIDWPQNIPLQGFELGALRRENLRHRLYPCFHVGSKLSKFNQTHTLQAFGEDE